jgi:hypothetical protein
MIEHLDNFTSALRRKFSIPYPDNFIANQQGAKGVFICAEVY